MHSWGSYFVPVPNHNPAGQNRLFLLFVKYPEPGSVKTRLGINIGYKNATKLYSAFILDILNTLKTGEFLFKIYFYPEEKKQLLSVWLGKEYSYMPQRGTNLGERMLNGFEDSFAKGHKKTIIIGSDSPDLPLSFLKEADYALTNHDAVIGPSKDGGYYLIGFRNDTFTSFVFDNIPWSGPSVFKYTISILNNLNYNIYILPEWNDIDTLDDIKSLIKRSSKSTFSNSETMAVISSKMKEYFSV